MCSTNLRTQMRYLSPYELHKLIINDYLIKRPEDTKYLNTDNFKEKPDYQVIKEHHKFLWDDNDEPNTWEKQFAKRYYEKLFKEYCIGDLSRYKENKVALRWRTEREVVSGKGQFICGNKTCIESDNLRSWEVNFVYQEKQERKNALVKIRLCPICSKKLNYHSKKREIKRMHKKNKYKEKRNAENITMAKKRIDDVQTVVKDCKPSTSVSEDNQFTKAIQESSWANHKPVETKSLEEEMEEYLQDLLL